MMDKAVIIRERVCFEGSQTFITFRYFTQKSMPFGEDNYHPL